MQQYAIDTKPGQDGIVTDALRGSRGESMSLLLIGTDCSANDVMERLS
jgi:hypothetical protein